MSGEIEVKDRRRAPWFYVDNHVLDKYAKRVGVTAWAIYTTICRLANEKVYDDGSRRRNRKISVNGLASMWGISRATVKRATSVLRKENLIRVTKRQGVSDVEILNVEQLNFDDKLNFGGLTNEPSKTVSDSSPLSPPKAHKRALPGLTNEPHSKPIDTKPSLSKPSGVDAGFKPESVSTKRQSERGREARPLYSQTDFDERDFRKWNHEMKELQGRPGASVGSNSRPPDVVSKWVSSRKCEKCKGKKPNPHDPWCNCWKEVEVSNKKEVEKWEEQQNEVWIETARKAAARAGILPRRIVEILKQVYPEDPNVPKIDQRRKKA